MEFKMGNISVKCKCCQTVTVIDNDALHKMKEFRCPSCNTRMPDYERSGIMMHFNYLVFQKIHSILGNTEKQFDYDINIFPHYELHDPESKSGY